MVRLLGPGSQIRRYTNVPMMVFMQDGIVLAGWGCFVKILDFCLYKFKKPSNTHKNANKCDFIIIIWYHYNCCSKSSSLNSARTSHVFYAKWRQNKSCVNRVNSICCDPYAITYTCGNKNTNRLFDYVKTELCYKNNNITFIEEEFVNDVEQVSLFCLNTKRWRFRQL